MYLSSLASVKFWGHNYHDERPCLFSANGFALIGWWEGEILFRSESDQTQHLGYTTPQDAECFIAFREVSNGDPPDSREFWLYDEQSSLVNVFSL